jgi:Na+-driven multidrug efflux pump
MVVMMIGFGMGMAASVLIGQNMGAGNAKRAQYSGYKALQYFEFIILPFSVLFFICPAQIIGIFTHNEEVLKIGINFLRFIAVTLPFLAPAIILSRGIAGAGDTFASAVMVIVTQLGLRVPLAYILTLFLKFGSNGIWLAINVSDIAGGLAMLWYFKKGFWQKKYYRHRVRLDANLVEIM